MKKAYTIRKVDGQWDEIMINKNERRKYLRNPKNKTVKKLIKEFLESDEDLDIDLWLWSR